MRDPFDSSPALRLGDAPAKKLIEESRAVRFETKISGRRAGKTASLDPAFGDAFGEAFSKAGAAPQEMISEAVIDSYFEAVARSFGLPARLLKGPDPLAMTATHRIYEYSA
jgi:hypothetical protein